MNPERFASMGNNPSSRRKWINRTGIFVTGALLGAGCTLGGQAINQHLNIDIQTVKPGGVWESPDDGENVGNVIHFAAKAYPNHQGDPPIAFVDFSALIRGTWHPACHVPTPPPQISDYTCDWEVPAPLRTPNQKITVVFDVHDQSGNVTTSANGVQTVFENR